MESYSDIFVEFDRVACSGGNASTRANFAAAASKGTKLVSFKALKLYVHEQLVDGATAPTITAQVVDAICDGKTSEHFRFPWIFANQTLNALRGKNPHLSWDAISFPIVNESITFVLAFDPQVGTRIVTIKLFGRGLFTNLH